MTQFSIILFWIVILNANFSDLPKKKMTSVKRSFFFVRLFVLPMSYSLIMKLTSY